MNEDQIRAIDLRMSLINDNLQMELEAINKAFEGRSQDSYTPAEVARLRSVRYKKLAAAEMIMSCLYELRDGLGLSDSPYMITEIAEAQAGIEELKQELTDFDKLHDE